MDLTLPVNEHEHVQGPADVPTNLLIYGDYECPTHGRILVVIGMAAKKSYLEHRPVRLSEITAPILQSG